MLSNSVLPYISLVIGLGVSYLGIRYFGFSDEELKKGMLSNEVQQNEENNTLSMEESTIQRTQQLSELEAILYSAGRVVKISRIRDQLKLNNVQEVQTLIQKLSNIYEQANSPLEVVSHPNGYALQLQSSYRDMISKVTKPLLSATHLRTLSFIAYHQPVEYKEVVEDRGSQAIRTMTILEEMGLIKIRIEENKKIIITSEFFADYFGFNISKRERNKELRSLLSTFDEPRGRIMEPIFERLINNVEKVKKLNYVS